MRAYAAWHGARGEDSRYTESPIRKVLSFMKRLLLNTLAAMFFPERDGIATVKTGLI